MKVRKLEGPDGCWEWTGSLQKNGYGRFRLDGVSIGAHRASYMLFVGPIPAGTELDHVCHSDDDTCRVGSTCPHRRCVNPAHLEPVTHRENILRGRVAQVASERSNRGDRACSKGHPYSQKNTYTDPRGRRNCRACNSIATASYRQRKRDARASRDTLGLPVGQL